MVKFKGTMAFADGNKARFEMEVEMEGKKQKERIVSDGRDHVADSNPCGLAD